MMKCPICEKGELQTQESIKGFIIKKKVITTYCPICDFSKKKEIKITRRDADLESVERLNKKTSERISNRKGGWER